jgi:hypothetical protein
MTDTFEVPDCETAELPTDEYAAPISIRKLDRVETTSFTSGNAC